MITPQSGHLSHPDQLLTVPIPIKHRTAAIKSNSSSEQLRPLHPPTKPATDDTEMVDIIPTVLAPQDQMVIDNKRSGGIDSSRLIEEIINLPPPVSNLRAIQSDPGRPLLREYSSSAESSSAVEFSERGGRGLSPAPSTLSISNLDDQSALPLDQTSLGESSTPDVFRAPSRRRQITKSERTPGSKMESRKGKERAMSMDGGQPSPKFEGGVVRSGTHSKRTQSSLASVERRLPLRTNRRIGALGISVSSESDGSRKLASRGWSEVDGESTDLASIGALVQRANRVGVNDSHFRGIVDDLTVQNKLLKGKLRKYETPKVSNEMTKDRLFEVKFFDGLPSDKRTEIESFLALYVQGLATLPSSVASTSALPSIAIPTPSPTPALIASPTLVNLFIPPFVPLPPRAIRPDLSRATSLASSVVTGKPRAEKRPRRRYQGDREILAASSYSGIEPESRSGTGNGMRTQLIPKRQKLASSALTTKIAVAIVATGEESEDVKKSMEIAEVLEKLFADSYLEQNGVDERGELLRGTSNEAYLNQILDHDNVEGWIYLRLAFTFGQLHRFSVTLAFIQSAIDLYTTKIEMSADGSMIRWIGPKPEKMKFERERVGVRSGSTKRRAGREGTSSSKSQPESEAGESTGPSNSLANSRVGPASTVATSIELAKSSIPSHAHHHYQHRLPSAPIYRSNSPLLSSDSLTPTVNIRSTHSSYVPFFEKRDDSVRDSLDSMSEARSEDVLMRRSKHGGIGGERNDGVIVFYANQPFCSDLSRDMGKYRTVEEGTLVDVEMNGMEVEPVVAPVVESEDEQEMIEDDDVMQIYSDGVLLKLGQEQQQSTKSQHQLRVSGTNEVVASDYFTLLVETLHYPSPAPSLTSPLSSTDQSIQPITKKRRLDSPLHDAEQKKSKHHHKILSSKVSHHYIHATNRRSSMRASIAQTTNRDDTSNSGEDRREDDLEEEEGEDDEARRQSEEEDDRDKSRVEEEDDDDKDRSSQKSSKGERRRRHNVPEITRTDYTTPLLATPDYLSSLSFPFFSWSPNRTNVAPMGRDSSLGRSSSAVRTNIGEEEDAEGEEREEEGGPIDLDQEVRI